MIGSTLIEEGRNKLCSLLQHNLDIFAWKPADMTGVARHIVEHRLKHVVQNAVQNPGVQNGGNQNGIIVVSGIANQNVNQIRNGMLFAARAEGNVVGNNGRSMNPAAIAQMIQFDFMAAAGDLNEIEDVDANCILMANLQQASTFGTQTDKAPVYDLDESAEVHNYNNCYDDEIFNMFTQEEQYTDLLEPIPEPHLSVYQEQCLTKKINALHLSSGKQITALNEEISNLNKQLSMEKSTVSSLLEEKKKLKSDFKIREDELLDKQILLENKIKVLDNILVKTGQSIQTMHMLLPKPDSFYHTEQKMALGYQNPFYLKQAQQKQQSLYNGKVLLEKHDPPVVHDSEETLQLAQEILKDENFPIVNQVDARLQNFEIQFLKEAAEFVRDFKSLTNEADDSLDKQKIMET
ncbi:hypothetical protein Tco_0337194 [Tanacetum coccineum]